MIPNKENSEVQNVRIKIQPHALLLTKLEVLKNEKIPGHEDQKLHIKYSLGYDGGLVIDQRPKEDEEIKKIYEYHKMIITDFEREEGSEGLIFKNKEIIDKQRAVMSYLLKNMGANLLSGKSIMNVSLPINIFDVRSHLQV